MVANIYQVAAFEALRVGAYDGTTQVSKLMEHGDFGLGTFNGLNGEMIALDGKVYRISAFGEAHAPEKDVQTPFAFVTRFRADHVHKVTHPLTSAGLRAMIDKVSGEGILAIRITGRFRDVLARSFSPQLKPYLPFQTILDRESMLPYGEIEGDFVGFRMPKSVAQGNLNVPGYHFHFLSHDRHRGGHVLKYVLESGTIQVMRVGKIVKME